MIDVRQADELLKTSTIELPVVEVPLLKAMGRVLCEDLYADEDFPPFNRVTMDGIAFRYETFATGQRTFAMEGIQAAGAEQKKLKKPGGCFEVMTGAILPEGTDTVVQYEKLEIDQEKSAAKILTDDVKPGKNVHHRGLDKQKGDLLAEKGKEIAAPEISIAASIGKTHIKVAKMPKIAVISTGDELVDIDEKPLPHQIRRSNIYAIAAELIRLGINASLHHLNDDRENLLKRLGELLEEHDILMLSGGVSKGKFDFVPGVLQELGVDQVFHRIKQKPGKPMWFGQIPGEKAVFGFPGNPVSTFMCFHRYFVPWLQRNLKQNESLPLWAELTEDFEFTSDLTYFLQVKVKSDRTGKIQATPIQGRGSGDHANLLECDGFLELPGGVHLFKKGNSFRLIRYRA